MEVLSIRALRRQATPFPTPYAIHGQVESLLSKTSRGGKPFYELNLADAEDQITLRIWEDSALFKTAEKFQPTTFVAATGDWFRNDPYGIEPKNLNLRELTEEEKASLLEGSSDLRAKQEADFGDIQRIISEMRDPRLQALCQEFMTQFGDRLRRTAAARNYHHARRGGLVEHVAQMMRNACAICSAYPNLNQDLVVAGVLFHDCGKLWESAYAENDFAMPYFELGELLGHISLGMEIVNKLWRDILSLPDAASWSNLEPASDQVRMHLLHLIASHHGEFQFGSPVLPKTPEAMVLHHIDNIDAKMDMFDRGYETAAPLTKNIFERVRPLPSRMVRPLGKVSGEDELPIPEEENPF